MEAHIAPATPDDATRIAQLAMLAVPDDNPADVRDVARQWLRGRYPMPYGKATFLTARTPAHGVVGMVCLSPPWAWAKAHYPRMAWPALTQHLAQVQLLAVEPEHRGCGVGTALLHAVEQRARAAGAHLAFAQVRGDWWPVVRWWRRRGYAVAVRGEPVLLPVRGRMVDVVDHEYHLVARPLVPGGKMLRRSAGHSRRTWLQLGLPQ